MKLALPVAVLLVLVCTGCGPDPVDGAPTPTATVTESATPTPTATATTAVSKPALSDLTLSPEGILTPDGITPVLIGQAPHAVDPALDILVFQSDACAWALDEYPDLDPARIGMWVPNYGPHTSSDLPGPFGILVDGGETIFISVYDEGLRTATGAHLNMTREQLLAAYPSGLELLTAGGGIEVYRLAGTAGDLNFSLWEDETGDVRVNQIVVTLPGYEVPLGGSDFGYFGVCFGA
jgi:hypothetical protein